MWVLVIIVTYNLFTGYGTVLPVHKLQEYTTLQDCEEGREYITKKMDQQYNADERDYLFACVYHNKPV